MIVDAHTHIFSPDVIARRAEHVADDPCFRELYGNAKAKLKTAEELITEMDSAGVDKAVIQNIGWSDPETCRGTNDYLLEAAARYPKRLIPFIAVQPNSGRVAVSEINRCVAAGARGIGELRPDTQGGFVGLERKVMRPLVEAAMAGDLVMCLHVDEPVGHHHAGKGSVTPQAIFPFISSFPELKLILAHWGGGLPFYTLMPEVKKALGNVWFDSAASPLLYQPEIYERVADLAGGDRILFGSDWPLLRQRRALEELRSVNLSTWTVKGIAGDNAAELLGLKDE
jgi:predicted TIM-barrel fold metal-dependent hydrolase